MLETEETSSSAGGAQKDPPDVELEEHYEERMKRFVEYQSLEQS